MLRQLAHLLSAALLATAACAVEPAPDDDSGCVGGKCDTPDDPPATACQKRRSDALESGQKAYTPNAIRWACSDVDGVNTNHKDDRGQEYCEYFAIVQPPPATEGGERPPAVDLGRPLDSGTTPLAVELTEDQIFYLEDHPTDVVGQCVFTSWHQDITEPYPVCKSASNCQSDILGFKLLGDYFRMKVQFNSNSAAADLVKECLKVPAGGDPANASDPLNDPYIRGCMMVSDLYHTEWRRSDPTVCAASMRLAECGCGVDINGDGKADPVDVPTAVVPKQPQNGEITLRGFPLGTWSGKDQLPAGCRYVDTGDASQTLVSCDFTGDDLLQSASDPKGRCREKYADNVVVHVPIPADKIVCTPPADGKYTSTCGAQPWVIGAENP
jgi:hypothetical protein